MTRGSLKKLAFAKFLLALLDERRSSGGWVDVREIAEEIGISRATGYRYLRLIEDAGVPLERDTYDNGVSRIDTAGVRCLLRATRRPADSIGVEARRRDRPARRSRAECAADHPSHRS